ncbi:hypothetical protein AVEN_92323-1 [Araneus ventricosus]|uniref:Uncharacterized protein n=1 Tax=Araneus ventricosus TaxID=182803 RepID=A0A4Y2ALB1_ARAVE|nr:hypothetical protein AVEN_92323-1 [Araneus ventricosus]
MTNISSKCGGFLCWRLTTQDPLRKSHKKCLYIERDLRKEKKRQKAQQKERKKDEIELRLICNSAGHELREIAADLSLGVGTRPAVCPTGLRHLAPKIGVLIVFFGACLVFVFYLPSSLTDDAVMVITLRVRGICKERFSFTPFLPQKKNVPSVGCFFWRSVNKEEEMSLVLGVGFGRLLLLQCRSESISLADGFKVSGP